jgi:uncharacterized membrane protein
MAGATNERLQGPVPGAKEAAMSISYENERSYGERPVVSDNMLAIAVYVLYFISYFCGITVLVGLVIAHVKVDEATPLLRSHYRFQIRTFWIGLLYVAIGVPLCMVLIGFPILLWWFVWSVVRIVKGTLLLSEHRPIVNPESWLFG